MSITQTGKGDKYAFRFDRVVPGHGRVLRSQVLPAEWDRAEAEAFDAAETARIYAELSGTPPSDPQIDEAVALYLTDKRGGERARRAVAAHLATFAWAYTGRRFSELPAVAVEVIQHGQAVGLSPATVLLRLSLLKAAARHAWKAHRLTACDPTPGMYLPPVRF